ncbi:uncharacterized protein N7473_005007 [Penicillium subrubescens]|uniref:uncharacterized protein n=1 Tax=Penicillium subrubescens TaxID=1316194 RepID=UPI0025451EE3|nr:uncharacterized protein N7473_005007 [Penicillium subrubescens]KAJ5900937.1 hypothetical protein N7473_005007 [Penicillium subrubescens]
MNATDISYRGPGRISFTPLLAPNAIFTTIFTILFLNHLLFTIRFWRFYGYAIGMLGGLLLELLGYVAKVQLARHGDKNGYIMYIIGLTLGPTFLSSSLYLGISQLQRHFESTCFPNVGPQLFTTIFILGDFACLCFIGVGGSLAAIYADSPIGVDLMMAGLGTQVLVTAIFCVVLSILAHKWWQKILRCGKKWYIIAAVCLLIRSCWRVAELRGGFNGPLASKEGIFIALDSIPMVIMCVILTFMHPRFWFMRVEKQAQLMPTATKARWSERVLEGMC